tara:strand:+ start:117 stop:251 length:135 start_codon:yes stop_codon:yes gene_type:complete
MNTRKGIAVPKKDKQAIEENFMKMLGFGAVVLISADMASTPEPK